MSEEVQNGVTSSVQDDLDRLEAEVLNQLSGRLLEFRLKCQGEGVVLMGRARCYYTKQLAQHAIMKSTDLPILQNEIEVT